MTVSFEDFFIKNKLLTNFSLIYDDKNKNNYNQLNFTSSTSHYPTIVNITATKMYASQYGEVGEFIIIRTGDTTQDLMVKYSIQGTAEDGVDYQSIANFVIIPAGASEVAILIQPQKSHSQGMKTVLLSLENLPKSNQYMLGANFYAVVNILDVS